MNRRVGAVDFEQMYAEDPDPWKLDSSPYERDKHAATLAAVPARSYPRALEIGCATGVLTALLAGRCANLVAIDFSPFAVARARRRVARLGNVSVQLAAFPEQTPAGPWALVVCSEVLYYLDAETLDLALAWFAAALESGAVVVNVHWRGPGRTEPLGGDDVHDRLLVELGHWHARDARRSGYRLDVFEGRAG